MLYVTLHLFVFQVSQLQERIISEDKALATRTGDLLGEWNINKPIQGNIKPSDALDVSYCGYLYITRENLGDSDPVIIYHIRVCTIHYPIIWYICRVTVRLLFASEIKFLVVWRWNYLVLLWKTGRNKKWSVFWHQIIKLHNVYYVFWNSNLHNIIGTDYS